MAERKYVTIVSGLPRSGTSMMMRMITEGGLPALVDNLRAADEDNPKGYFEFEPVKKTKKDASWVKDGVGKVVKMVHLILLDMPLEYEYRVVFMRRNLHEVLKSQDKMLVRSGKNTDDMPKERLMEIYRVQIHKVQHHMKQHPDRFKFIEVDYNETMKNPAPSAERISAFLDGLDPDKMCALVDPTLYRNRAAT
ncbi:MAG: sulfotransferase family protein [Planctomycetota bacterium]